MAAIKRQLCMLVPGVCIFLDVDDLEEISALEEYIDQTCVILIFLSKGYFLSRNCMREVRAAVLEFVEEEVYAAERGERGVRAEARSNPMLALGLPAALSGPLPGACAHRRRACPLHPCPRLCISGGTRHEISEVM